MHDQQESTQRERLRPAPRGRFAGVSQVVDLGEALQALRAEAHPAHGGHRQITLLHHTPITQLLVAFEAGGALANHAAHGMVTLHVLEGRLMVQADGQDHTLSAGHVLILQPDVLHNVHALEASAMLLTVCLESQP